eukprot:evm.model.scf_3972.1 EVM.evm.TU.scf_3972.1   scf_3972:2084-3550(-)
MPVHSGVLGLHSQFFRKMIKDLKNDEESAVDGKLIITLDERVALKDVEIMLQIFYGVRKDLETEDEAKQMALLGDKYDVPLLCQLSDGILSKSAEGFYFVKPRNLPDQTEDQMQVAQWLGVAERLGMKELRRECQCVIMKDLLSSVWSNRMSHEVDVALESLKIHGASARSMGEITAATWDFVCKGGVNVGALNKFHCFKCNNVVSVTATDNLEDTECPSCKQ